MNTTEAMIDKLASKLGDEELGILAHLMNKVAHTAVETVVTREQQREALIDKLASAGFTPQEVAVELQKIAEERQVQDECEKIAQDCVAMGNIIGKTASDVFLNNIRGFIDKHAQEEESVKEEVKSAVEEVEEEEDKEEAKEDVEEAKDELSKAKEEAKKEASARRAALRQALLQVAKL